MAERYLNLGLVVGVVIWLGIVMFTPGPVETAKAAPAPPCSVICMDTQPITWPVYPPAQPGLDRQKPDRPNSDWPDQQPI
jgi:hypothetical protein